MGFDFSTEASYFMRSASAAAVTRMRFASASERFLCLSNSALLSIILACAAASAFCSVDSLRACASSLLCSICFCFNGSVYCIASASDLACSTRTCACASSCFTSRAFCASASSSAIFTCLPLISVSVPRRSFSCSFNKSPSSPLAYSTGSCRSRSTTSLTNDPVARQPRRNRLGCLCAQFLPLRGKDFPGHVIRRELPVNCGNDRGHHLLAHWLRQIRVNRVQQLGIQPVSHGNRQADVQPFPRLHRQHITLLLWIFGRLRRVHLLACIVDRDGIHQRRHQMHAGIQRTGARAPDLADAYSRSSVRNHHKAFRDQQHQGARRYQLQRQPPAHRPERAASQRPHLRTGFVRLAARKQTAQLLRKKNVVSHQSRRASEECGAQNHQQILQSQHRVTPFFPFPGALRRSGDRPLRR